MLLKYGMKNYSSFKEGVEVSFELNESAQKNIGKGPVTNIMCVSGANGSGKTNLLKGLTFLGVFCAHSFAFKPDDQIPLDSYFFNNEPTEFFVEFMDDDKEYFYKYDLIVSKEKVLKEKLTRKIKREKAVVERVGNEIIECIQEFDELCEIKKIRSNASIISIANQHEIDSIVPFYHFFACLVSNVGYTGLNDSSKNLKPNQVTKLYYDDEKLFTFAKKLICKSDLGISNIKIGQNEREDEKIEYFPIFTHPNKEKNKFLTYMYESSGTKTLYLKLLDYYYALNLGGVLIMDEFDINLHPHILPMLLDYFEKRKLNKYNAQLIFTTHNAEILNKMGKYRTFLINKDDNESFGYRLDQIPGDLLRNDRDISPIYNAGKIGGVPRV